MAEVPSTFQLQAGSPAPSFELPDGTGALHRLDDLAEGKKALVIVFACNHCPFVVHLADVLGTFADEFSARGVQTVAISANDVAHYPDDAPDKMVAFAAAHGWNFPYLHDETQEVAKTYAAACTPDFYLFDSERKLTYAGQFDSTRPRPGREGGITGEDLRDAVEKTLAGEPVPQPWKPSTGCNIKWKKGGEPAYF